MALSHAPSQQLHLAVADSKSLGEAIIKQQTLAVVADFLGHP